jgi:hypothetical protein
MKIKYLIDLVRDMSLWIRLKKMILIDIMILKDVLIVKVYHLIRLRDINLLSLNQKLSFNC